MLDLSAAFLEQRHQRRFAGGLGQHLHQHATGVLQTCAVDALADKDRRRGLLRVQQVGGDVITNASTDEFDGRAEGLPFPEVPDDVEIARPGGLLEVELMGPIGACLLYTSPSPRDRTRSRMPSSA